MALDTMAPRSLDYITMSSAVNPEDVLKNRGAALGGEPDELIKAYFVGGSDGGSESKIMQEPDKQQSLFQSSGALMPLYDPAGLAVVYENSSCLRSNVDAYITNIDSYGHQFFPTIDLDQPVADVRIRNAIVMERRAAKNEVLLVEEPTEDQKRTLLLADIPTPAEIKARKEELRVEISEEKAFLELFFENCTVDIPFSGPEGLRGLTRMNLEVIGNGYWEVLRDGLRQVAQFNRVPAESMRLLPIDDEITEVEILVRVSPLTWAKKKVRKRFRRYVQCWEGNNKVVYFKEFGDPRIVSARTGKVYKTVAEMQAADKDHGPVKEATEIFWFKITSLRSAYGAPRWIGTLLAVLGNRQSEEGNFIYFENRSVPPLAILVSGGRLNKDSVKSLEDHIRNNIKGSRNNHKILILEAESATNPGTVAGAGGGGTQARMKIEIVPLSDSQLKDALFQQYDERNFDKVGQAFRLPRLLRGDVRDFNRSTAVASIDFAEVQVFGPIRQQFDWIINKHIMPAIGARYHVFRSNAPTVRDPEALSMMIERMVKANVLTPGEGRALCSAVFNEELPVIDAAWTKQPFGMTASGWPVEDDLNTPENETDRYKIARPELGGGGGGGGADESSDTSDDEEADVGKRSVDDEDEEDDQDVDDADDADDNTSAKRRKALAARALAKIGKHLHETGRRELSRALNKIERVVIKLPEAQMRALVDET
jgi:PBSX family phage portal protein